MCFSIVINRDPSKLGEQSEAGINRKNMMCKEVFQNWLIFYRKCITSFTDSTKKRSICKHFMIQST